MIDGISIVRFPTVVVAVDGACLGLPLFGIIDQSEDGCIAEFAAAEVGPAGFDRGGEDGVLEESVPPERQHPGILVHVVVIVANPIIPRNATLATVADVEVPDGSKA